VSRVTKLFASFKAAGSVFCFVFNYILGLHVFETINYSSLILSLCCPLLFSC
jgi:hypothetical protein